MAPTLFGPHHRLVCSQCRHRWSVATETCPGAQSAMCGCCGAECSLGPTEPGQLVQATPAVSRDAIGRLDCVVFRADHSLEAGGSQAWICKRVWGLPGESIRMSGGDLLVNGRTFAKSLEQLRAVAMRIDHGCDDANLRGWQLVSEDSSQSSNSTWPAVIELGQSLRWQPQTSVYDDYECDLATPRNLAVVDDLLFELQLSSDHKPGSSATLELEICYRGKLYETRQQFDAVNIGSKIATWQLAIAACDGRVLLQCSDLGLVEHELVASAACAGLQTAVTIKADTAKVHLADCAVYRDLYLRSSERDPSVEPERTVQLKSDEYFVIGDNLPISIDSRNQLGPLPAGRIWGVLRADR